MATQLTPVNRRKATPPKTGFRFSLDHDRWDDSVSLELYDGEKLKTILYGIVVNKITNTYRQISGQIVI